MNYLKNKKQVLINIVVFIIIMTGYLFLYNPFNETIYNQAKTSVQFIYQQF
jgi:hypothetical protein